MKGNLHTQFPVVKKISFKSISISIQKYQYHKTVFKVQFFLKKNIIVLWELIFYTQLSISVSKKDMVQETSCKYCMFLLGNLGNDD